MIGNVLKEARSKINLSQPEVASLVGVTKQTYLKWENDVTEPKASQVVKLAEVLQVSEVEICTGKLNRKMGLDKFIIHLSRVSASSNLITLKTWEQIPDHVHFLMSLENSEISDDDDAKIEAFSS